MKRRPQIRALTRAKKFIETNFPVGRDYDDMMKALTINIERLKSELWNGKMK